MLTKPAKEEEAVVGGRAGVRMISSYSSKLSTCFLLELMPGRHSQDVFRHTLRPQPTIRVLMHTRR